jgi:hypothetical protein
MLCLFAPLDLSYDNGIGYDPEPAIIPGCGVVNPVLGLIFEVNILNKGFGPKEKLRNRVAEDQNNE